MINRLSFSVVLLAILAIGVYLMPDAKANTTTPEAYASQVNGICVSKIRNNSKLIEQISVPAIRKLAKEGKYGQASQRFFAASKELNKAIKAIAVVPRPSNKATQIKQWLTQLKTSQTLLRKTGKALQVRNKYQASKSVVLLARSNSRANGQAIGLYLDECRLILV